MIRNQVTPPFVVQQPTDLHLALQHEKGYAVCFQVVSLGVIHGNKQVGGLRRKGKEQQADDQQEVLFHGIKR